MTPRLVLATMLGMSVVIAGICVMLTALVRSRRNPPDWAALTRRLTARPWSWREIVETTFILVGLHGWFLAAIALASLAPPAVLENLEPVALVVQTLLFQGAGVIVVLAMLTRPRHSWWRSFGWDRELPKAIGQGVMFYLGAMPAVVVVTLFYRAILDAIGYPIEAQPVVELFLRPDEPSWLKIYLGVLAVTGAPLVEELLFRGIAMPPLARRFGPAAAIAGASVLFAILHLSIPALVPLFSIGAAFAIAYLMTGRILVPIVMHACFNAVSLALMLLAGDTTLLGWI